MTSSGEPAAASWDWRGSMEKLAETTRLKVEEARLASLELAEEASKKSRELATATTANVSTFGETLKRTQFGEGVTKLMTVEKKQDVEAAVELPTAQEPAPAPSEEVESSEDWSGGFWNRFSPAVDAEGADIESREQLIPSLSDFANQLGSSGKELYSGLRGTVATAVVDSKECGLTRPQRFRFYVILLMISSGFFCLSFNFIPMVIIKPAKFATAFALGTVASIAAKFMLNGPHTQLRLMFHVKKLPYTMALLGSTSATLYFCFISPNFILIILCSAAQIASLLYYLFADTPGGKQGILLFFRLIYNSARLIMRPCVSALSG